MENGKTIIGSLAHTEQVKEVKKTFATFVDMVTQTSETYNVPQLVRDNALFLLMNTQMAMVKVLTFEK